MLFNLLFNPWIISYSWHWYVLISYIKFFCFRIKSLYYYILISMADFLDIFMLLEKVFSNSVS